ncbi:MAG: CHASE2 domain-containing protein [Muribaculaceae bacterium]|nr:CHASE2 domain-containing protein [Muribaculaceae bacterium]
MSIRIKNTPPIWICCLTKVGIALAITALAWGLSFVLMQPFSVSVATLVSTNDKSDFDITDFYNIVADSRSVRAVDRNITILDISGATREDVAVILEALPDFEPKVVGLDVTFDVEHANDSLLISSIQALPDMVMIVDVVADKARNAQTFHLGETSYFYEQMKDRPYGASNLPTKYAGGVVREFRVDYPDSLGAKIPSFAVAVAEQVDTTIVNRLRSHKRQYELINYPSRRFKTVYWEELGLHAEDIRDHVVLIGAVDNLSDKHATPHRRQVSGIEIHAHILGTIMNENYLEPLNSFWSTIIAFALCFILAFLYTILYPGFRALVLRFVQLLLLYVIIVIGYHYFIDKCVVINFSYAILMLTFVLFVSDICFGIKGFCDYYKTRKLRKKEY